MHRLFIVLLGIAATTVAATSSSSGDAVAGKQVYASCLGCHSPQRDRTGPRHCGLIGRGAGSVPGFDYSDAMRDSEIVWSAATLDRFLKSPMTYIPGTRMGIRGIKDSDRRSDLIAYLQEMSDSPDVCEVTP